MRECTHQRIGGCASCTVRALLDDVRATFDEKERLRAENEKLRAEIADLRAEHAAEVARLSDAAWDVVP